MTQNMPEDAITIFYELIRLADIAITDPEIRKKNEDMVNEFTCRALLSISNQDEDSFRMQLISRSFIDRLEDNVRNGSTDYSEFTDFITKYGASLKFCNTAPESEVEDDDYYVRRERAFKPHMHFN